MSSVGLHKIYEVGKIYYKKNTSIIFLKISEKMVDLCQGYCDHEKKEVKIYYDMHRYKRKIFKGAIGLDDTERIFIKWANLGSHYFKPYFIDDFELVPLDYKILE